jgi:8-oxo-dGTP pyrophosphatase MutT (NUDIX family)
MTVVVRTKRSCGLILCRLNPASGAPEVLLTHKRLTYAYSDFVHGAYRRAPDPGAHVRQLLAGMCCEELLLLHSLDFGHMWAHARLGTGPPSSFATHRAHFRTLVAADGGAELRLWVRAARATGERVWEVPKGRPGPGETETACAVREMFEETGVAKREYRLVPGARLSESHVSGGVRYRTSYVVAVPWWVTMLDQRPTIRPLASMAETGECRWFDLGMLQGRSRCRGTDQRRRVEKLASRAMPRVQRYMFDLRSSSCARKRTRSAASRTLSSGAGSAPAPAPRISSASSASRAATSFPRYS